MSLHSAKSFGKFALGLKAVTLAEQWESHVVKVGGKVFALCGADGSHITFKVSEVSFEGLSQLEGIGQAPYFAKRQWISVSKGSALPDAEIRAYIAASHRMVAGKLTKKLQAELGLVEI